MIIGLGLTAISLPLLVFSVSLLQATAAIVDPAESHAYGAAYGLFSMFHAIGMIAGSLIGRILTDLLSIKEAIYVISIVIFICTLVLVSTKKKTTSYTVSKLNEME
jgi:sugar phosphate permease